jgi:hypothetical protein
MYFTYIVKYIPFFAWEAPKFHKRFESFAALTAALTLPYTAKVRMYGWNIWGMF